jgi:CDP-diacylglycerol pyrophosphatase
MKNGCMKNRIFFLLSLVLMGCASSLDIVKFKQDIGMQETGEEYTISRCAYIPFEYKRQSQQHYLHCGYVQSESGFSLYTKNNSTEKYQKNTIFHMGILAAPFII